MLSIVPRPPLPHMCSSCRWDKVVDFGLALDADARQWDECRMGTSMYMAPELAKHRVQVCCARARLDYNVRVFAIHLHQPL